MKARIYKPVKNATQSGRANTELWVLEYDLETPRRPDTLMGWISAGDTLNQVRMKFTSKDAAVAFAQGKNMEYEVIEPKARVVKPQSYLDNFKFRANGEE